MGSSASKDFNPEQDILDLIGNVIIVTGGKYAFRVHLSAIITDACVSSAQGSDMALSNTSLARVQRHTWLPGTR